MVLLDVPRIDRSPSTNKEKMLLQFLPLWHTQFFTLSMDKLLLAGNGFQNSTNSIRPVGGKRMEVNLVACLLDDHMTSASLAMLWVELSCIYDAKYQRCSVFEEASMNCIVS